MAARFYLYCMKLLLRLLKITGLSLVGIMFLLFLIPVLFPGTVAEKVKNWANTSLRGELNFSKVRLSFFNHFPSLTVTLYNFSLKGSVPFQGQPLVAAEEIALGINIKQLLLNKRINIDKIFISDAYMNVQVDEKGAANYNVYENNQPTGTSDTAASNTALRLEKIIVENSHLVYNDRSVDILINAKGFNYTGSGDLSKAIFDLDSHANIDSLDFFLGKDPYLLHKKINADLVTKINTHSLSFIFQKNELLVNRLPVQFNGRLDFLKNGYDINFTLNASKSQLADFITALPPQYLGWQQQTTIKGTTDLLLTLKGKYIAADNIMPNLAFNMKIRDGYIRYRDAPLPASNLFLNLDTQMPAMRTDSLQVKVDSLFFNIDKDYLSAVITTKGVEQPFIKAAIAARLDLEQLDKALGLQNITLRGKTDTRFSADGLYATGPNPASLRHENIVLGIPTFNLQSTLTNGYFKYDSLPLAVKDINFTVNSSCADNDYRHAGISISGLSAAAMNNFIKGNLRIGSIAGKDVDARLQANLNLGDIGKIYPLEGLALAGLLQCTLNAKGIYDAAKKTFPTTVADIHLQDGSIKTSYYPQPVTAIQLVAKASDPNGSLKALQLHIEPASFNFEGKPFRVKADLQNFEDIAYNINANGELDLAKIYKVFSQKGLDVSGFIKADLSLQGRQSDALNKRYNRLHNEGSLQVKDLQTSTEYFPQPFLIKEGLFNFKQDKIWFKKFLAAYGQSDFRMGGYLQNAVDYALSNHAVLAGNFTVSANYINADEFMAFAPVKKDSGTAILSTVANTAPAKASGVIIVPAGLDLSLTATAKKLSCNGLMLDNAKGHLSIQQGRLVLQQTGFTLAGCEVLMDATYASTSPEKAVFDYTLQANNFDIKRAYNEIKLFHDMATAAGKAQGIVSLDYHLKGVLDENMRPVYPSLEGAGVVNVKNVKVYGMKLFSTVSRKTGKDSINNPSLANVAIKSSIKNNVITIERFKFKVAGFRPRIEGQTSFDGKLNIKMRLGLPPLGIVGIPMRITGTQENPKVKLGKGDQEDIPETEYKEEQ